MIPPRHDQVQLEPWERRALEAMERHFHLDGRPDGHPDSQAPLPPDHPDDAGRGSFARWVRWFLGRG